MKKLILVFLTLFLNPLTFSQIKSENVVDISKINDSVSIINYTQLFIDTNNINDINIIKNKPFTPLTGFSFKKTVPPKLIPLKFYYSFTLQNTSTITDTVYLCPGYLIENIKLYTYDSAVTIKTDENYFRNEGFLGIVVPASATKKFIVQLSLAHTNAIILSADLINKNYLPKYQTVLYNQEEQLRASSYILSGILLLMLLFTTSIYIVSNKKEFFYYCMYTLCMLCLIFLKAVFRKKIDDFSVFFTSYLDFILLTVGTIFYIAFTRFFLDTKKNYKTLDKLFKFEEWMLMGLIIIFTILHYFTNSFWLEDFIENSMKFLTLFLGIIYIILALKKKERYSIYLGYGNAAMIIFSIASWLLILDKSRGNNFISSPLLYYNLGLTVSLIFFLFGLTYKNTNELVERTKKEEALKQEAEKKEIENQIALIKVQQEERNRISADMHDDLGAGMTSIRLYSELAKNKINNKNYSVPEIDKISSQADELLNKMNAIIWSMASNYDTLENLIAYIREYSLDYFENTGVDCKLIFPDSLPQFQIKGQVRRNIFLVIKEALNNILKHSKATKAEIIFKYNHDKIELSIHDNGIGIDFEKIKKFSNGLLNMRKRIESTGMSLFIENKNGTLLKIEGKITN